MNDVWARGRVLLGELLHGEDVTARTARRILPLFVILPVVGALRLLAVGLGIIDDVTGTALMVVSGSVLIGVVVGVALLSLRASERSRIESERSLERFFELSVDLFVEAGFDGRFQRINPAWEATLGHEPTVLTSRPFMDFVHPDDREATEAAFGSLLGGEEVIDFENRYRAHDGTYHWLQWNAKASVPERLVRAVARDVTDERRRRADEARRKAELDAQREAARTAAEQASQAKSDFLAGMSHELRTPLNAILGFSDLMRGEVDPDGTLHVPPEWAEHIHRGGQHLLGLINDILDLSKVEAGRIDLQPSVLDLESSVREAIEAIGPLAARKHQEVESVILPGLHVSADRARFRQVLYNLLSNAIKHTPEGGAIRVEAAEAADGVVVSVVDSGVGIAPQDQARIFDAFWQARGPNGRSDGTGLGLTLSRRLMEAHGGTLTVESSVGVGSRFSVHFPSRDAAAGPEVVAAHPPRPTPESRAHGGRILLVEDDSSTVRLLRTYLEPEGYALRVAATGEEALELATSEQPDLILLDVLLPDIDGWDVLRRLKSDPATEAIPVVFESVVDEPGVGIALGAADYLLKPIDRRQLLSAVARASRARSADGRGRHVLAVDDEPSDLEVVVTTLRAEGYEAVGVTSGSEALELAAASPPDVVICDLIMPPPDGFEVISALRENAATSHIPIIVLTAHDLSREDRDVLNHRVVTVLAKTCRRDELLEWLARLVPPNGS